MSDHQTPDQPNSDQSMSDQWMPDQSMQDHHSPQAAIAANPVMPSLSALRARGQRSDSAPGKDRGTSQQGKARLTLGTKSHGTATAPAAATMAAAAAAQATLASQAKAPAADIVTASATAAVTLVATLGIAGLLAFAPQMVQAGTATQAPAQSAPVANRLSGPPQIRVIPASQTNDAKPAAPAAAATGALCTGFGPQTPRDISQPMGTNPVKFAKAPAPTAMNLCNIHTHTNAEHKGPGFSLPAAGDPGGFMCNNTNELTPDQLEDPAFGHGSFEGVKPGDTIEVHWVYTSCDVAPGPGLGSCLSDACANPSLRVETQVFLVVNDPYALDFMAFAYQGTKVDGRHQPKSLPLDTGTPVVFPGSTTGPKYSQSICSPMQVTWSVRPKCARLDISSLYEWSLSGNVFEEDHSHGIRELVTAPQLLSPIQ